MKHRFSKIIILIILSTLLIGCHKKNNPPYTPYTPIGPAMGATGIPYEFASLAIDPDDDSVAIRFDWGNGDTSAWSQLVATEDSIKMFFSWSVTDTYYVRAQAKDANENFSKWSLPHIFIIIQNQPPNPPAAPSGPSTGCPDTFYLFSSYASDPDEDSVAIRFDWGDGNTSEWSYPLPNRFPVLRAHYWSYPDTFYIKAQARGMSGETSAWSQEHQIIISNGRGLNKEKSYGQNKAIRKSLTVQY